MCIRDSFQWALEKGNIDIVIYAPPNLKLRELGKKFHYETLYNTCLLYTSLRAHIYQIRKIVDKPFEEPLIETRHGFGWAVRAKEDRGE